MKDPKITKYYSQKTHPVAMILGVAMIIAGFCVWLFLYWPSVSMPLMLAGAVILLLLNMQTKDSEIDALCGKLEAGFRQAFEEQLTTRGQGGWGSAEQVGTPLYTTTYLTEGNGILTRRGNDGRVRSSLCQSVGILMENADVKLGRQMFSLISGEAYTPIFSVYAFSELSDVALRESMAPHTVIMEVYDIAGETVFRAQVSNDANIELTVQNIRARIQKAHSYPG